VKFFNFAPFAMRISTIKTHIIGPGRLALFSLLFFAASLVCLQAEKKAGAPPPAKNIILMIVDGAGFNTFHACSYYEMGRLGAQIYDRFPVKLGCSTWALDKNGSPQGYDPEKMWEDLSSGEGDGRGGGCTDSAAAATALNSGIKTMVGRVNVDAQSRPTTTLAQLVQRSGKSVGTVTTVQFVHATPACVWSHDPSRYHYEEIARQMILGSGLDVIMGAGHPEFDNSGAKAEAGAQSFKYVGGAETWQALKNGSTGRGWTLIETGAEFEALAAGVDLPHRVIGIPKVYQTLQYERASTGMGARNRDLPTLATMARGALNLLARDPDGFYLQIEGGAVDWANHEHKLERMIEEQIDFNRAVNAVVDWIEAESGWDETLLIVTSDHECGMLWGSGSYTDTNGDGDFDQGIDTFKVREPIVNRGAGNLPGVQYGSKGHTNALVPLFAKGCGAEEFERLAVGRDAKAGEFWGFSGKYVDNTDIFKVMARGIDRSAIERNH